MKFLFPLPIVTGPLSAAKHDEAATDIVLGRHAKMFGDRGGAMAELRAFCAEVENQTGLACFTHSPSRSVTRGDPTGSWRKVLHYALCTGLT